MLFYKYIIYISLIESVIPPSVCGKHFGFAQKYYNIPTYG